MAKIQQSFAFGAPRRTGRVSCLLIRHASICSVESTLRHTKVPNMWCMSYTRGNQCHQLINMDKGNHTRGRSCTQQSMNMYLHHPKCRTTFTIYSMHNISTKRAEMQTYPHIEGVVQVRYKKSRHIHTRRCNPKQEARIEP